MKRIAVVQARMGSSRLPGKVLADVAGRPMLAHLLNRLEKSRQLSGVVVATTDEPEDDEVAAVASELGAQVLRGSRDDVLSRYVLAQRETGAAVIVRITADCPLVDPEIVDLVTTALTASPDCDYASNVLERTYPQGLDVEAFTADALARIDAIATSAEEREHVTWAVRFTHPALFRVRSVTDAEDNSDLRWTVDEERDLQLVRRLFRDLHLDARPMGYREILAHVRAHPELTQLGAELDLPQPERGV